MKKFLLLTALSTILIPQTVFAQNQSTIETCQLPGGPTVTISIPPNQTIDDVSTIQYGTCLALQGNPTQLNKANCSTEIRKTKEFENLDENEKQPAITKCERQVEDLQRSFSKENNSAYTDSLKTQIKSDDCVTNDPEVKNLGVDCTTNPNTASEGLTTLQNVFNNNFVYQLIEPITNENLVIQKRTCSYEFLRNRDGLLQVANPDNNSVDQTRNNNFYQNNSFIITEKKCYVTFVGPGQCQPNLILDARITFDEDLPVSTYCKTYQVISGSSGTGFIKGFVNIIYRLAVGIVGVIAVIVIVVNGIRISTAGDDSGVVSDAKERIAQSIFGLAILFLAWIILRSVNPNFFTTDNLDINDPRAPQNTIEEAQPASNETTNE